MNLTKKLLASVLAVVMLMLSLPVTSVPAVSMDGYDLRYSIADEVESALGEINATTEAASEESTEPTSAATAEALESAEIIAEVTTDPVETEPIPSESRYFLRGTMCDWNEGTVLYVDGSAASVTMSLDADIYKFKIYDFIDDIWYGNNGTMEDEATGWTFKTTADNCTLVATGGIYNFKVYINSENKLKVDVTMVAEDEPETMVTEATEATTEFQETQPVIAPGEIPEGLEYSIYDSEVTITNYTGIASHLVIPETIDGYPVTQIGTSAFENCKMLKSITLPEGLTVISYNAFLHCTNLTEINMPKSVKQILPYAFSTTGYYYDEDNWVNGALYIGSALIDFNSDLSTRCYIKSGTTVIANEAFMSVDNLLGVTFPDGLISIGDDAFKYCSSLKDINNMPLSLERVGAGAFEGTAFYDNSSNWTKGALYKDHVLIKVTDDYVGSYSIQSGTTLIANNACASCHYLTKITIPDSVTRIGDNAFATCGALTNVTIPDSVTNMESFVFNGCERLESVQLSQNLTRISYGMFFGCKSLTEVNIPESVTYIEGHAFYDCHGLDSITISGNVTRIGDKAFYGCLGLSSLEICEGVKEIGKNTFEGCKYLETVIIPASVTVIEECAFYNCYSITDVYYKGKETQWNDTSVGSYNNDLLDANIHFERLTPCADLAFSGASLTLHDNLCINYKVNESLFTEADYENPYVIFELNEEEFTVTDYEVVSGKYVFDFSDISPANMNDTVKATLYATFDGVEYQSETREYSVATYCYNMLSKYNTDDYAELRALLVDLLNYGAMTQIYTNHNVDALVNSNLTTEQKAWGTSEAPVYETVQNLSYSTIDEPSVQWMGGGLNLEDSVTMRFKISAESIENLTVKAETDTSLWTIPAEEFEATTGGYYVFFDGLDASQMSEPVYLTVYEGDTPVSNTICYSVESYAYSKQSSTDINLVNLLEAMMKYGNSAYAYVN